MIAPQHNVGFFDLKVLFMYRLLNVIGVALLCAGCVTPEHSEPIAPAPAAEVSSAHKVEASGPAEAVAPAVDPFMISFDKFSARPPAEADAKITALLPQLQAAKSILVRGYCDRHHVGNARAAALSRADSIKRKLEKAGIPSAKIVVRYDTEQVLHGVRIVVTD